MDNQQFPEFLGDEYLRAMLQAKQRFQRTLAQLEQDSLLWRDYRGEDASAISSQETDKVPPDLVTIDILLEAEARRKARNIKLSDDQFLKSIGIAPWED